MIKRLTLCLILPLTLVLALSGCATVGEVRDLVRLSSNLDEMLKTGVLPPESELRALANRPLPPPPGLTYDLALTRTSLAALMLGDLARTREISKLALKHSSSPETISGVLSTAALAEDLSGNYMESMRLHEQILRSTSREKTNQPRTANSDKSQVSIFVNAGLSALRAGRYEAVRPRMLDLDRISKDLSYSATARIEAELWAGRLGAMLMAQRDGNYLEAYERAKQTLESHNQALAQLKLTPQEEALASAKVGSTLAAIVGYAIEAGRTSAAAVHVEELRRLSQPTAQWARAEAEVAYLQAVGDYAGALEAERRKSPMMQAGERQWLVMGMSAASTRAGLLGGLGRWPEALDQLKAVPAAMAAPPSAARDYYLGTRALASVMVGAEDPSIGLLLSRESEYKKARNTTTFLLYYAAKTIIHYRLGERNNAPEEYARAVAAGRELSQELRRYQASGARRDAAVAEWLIRMAKEAYAASASFALERGAVTTDDLLDAVVTLQMSDLDSDIAAAAARRAEIPGISTAQLRRLQDLQLVARRAQRQVAALAQASDADAETLGRFSREANEAAEELDRHLAQVRAAAPQVTQAWGGNFRVRVADIQRRLAPDEAVAVFAPLGDNSTLALLISPGSFKQSRLASGRDQLASRVARVRRSVTFDASVQVPPFDVQASRELHDQLFGWTSSSLVPVRSLTVVAGGPLGSIPFGLLLRPEVRPTRTNDYRAMNWLIRSVAINHSPSVLAWYSVTASQVGSKANGFLAWADPDFGGKAGTGAGSTRALRASLRGSASGGVGLAGQLPANLGELLPPLPETKDEALSIARTLGASVQRDVVTGPAATRTSVLRESASGGLARRNVLMFATHGLVPAQVPGLDQPALAMAREPGATLPSLLQLEDVLSLQVDADWVLLSACSTAAADSVRGDPLSGLARGFFFAGARALLVTHWEVESESAAAITTRTIERFVRNPRLTRAQALQQASVELIEGRNADADWAHPAFWAPYALVGNGGRGSPAR